MTRKFGNAAELVLNLAGVQQSKSASYKIVRAIDWDQPVFRCVEDCIKQAGVVVESGMVYRNLEKAAADFGLGCSGVWASVLDSVGLLAMRQRLKRLVTRSRDTAQATDNDDEIRSIKGDDAGDFMRNDEVISGYNPSEVYDAYNEISGLTPRGSTQAASCGRCCESG